ncbi:PREDICTED: uncharacterized protein LOC108611950, partial [Drosophila arizonae]|uniref:Uncharacterized protein LOC108611950 n=1 Tax=Drosophila arizonae TaxID=7263 RepID=A0ABM1P0A6_DROAR
LHSGPAQIRAAALQPIRICEEQRARPDYLLELPHTTHWTAALQCSAVHDETAQRQLQENSVAIYSATSRGRMQLIYGGQPFIFEKTLKLSTGEEKRYWRCNQWWNQKCRSRVFTINDIVCPLNRFHTHEEIVRRKKRVRRIQPAQEQSNANAKTYSTAAASRQEQQQQQPQVQVQHDQQQQQQHLHHTQQLSSDAMLGTALSDEAAGTIDVNDLGMHLKYEEIVADVTGIVGGHTHARVLSRKK